MPKWFYKPSPWLFFPVLAALMLVDFFLTSSKAQALAWDAVFLIALFVGGLRRRSNK